MHRRRGCAELALALVLALVLALALAFAFAFAWEGAREQVDGWKGKCSSSTHGATGGSLAELEGELGDPGC